MRHETLVEETNAYPKFGGETSSKVMAKKELGG